ncbi:hypothetical protein AKJ16_DCAP13410 [Drosera capensis]
MGKSSHKYHSNVGVVAEAGFTDNRKIGAFPAIGLEIPQQPVRHRRRRWNEKGLYRFLVPGSSS